MKTLRFPGMVVAFTLLLTIIVSCAQYEKVKGSDNYKIKEVKIDNFDRIELLGSPTIEYTQSKSNKSELKIYGSDNLIELLECKVVNGKLTVKFKDNTNIEYGRDGRLKIIVSSPSLKEARLQGSGDILLNNTVKATDLLLNLQGSGDIRADDLVCTSELIITLQGSGDISIKRSVQAGTMTLKLQGSGDIDLYNLVAEDVVATLQGSGDLKVEGKSVSRSVVATVQGSGDLSFTGIKGQNVKAELSGSGDMKLIGVTEQAVLVLNNSGDMDTEDLQAIDVDARVSGSGNINCAVSGTLKTHISGSGSIGYRGNPRDILADGKRKPHQL